MLVEFENVNHTVSVALMNPVKIPATSFVVAQDL